MTGLNVPSESFRPRPSIKIEKLFSIVNKGHDIYGTIPN